MICRWTPQPYDASLRLEWGRKLHTVGSKQGLVIGLSDATSALYGVTLAITISFQSYHNIGNVLSKFKVFTP